MRRRWVVTRCGHTWPDMAEAVRGMGYKSCSGNQVRGPGAQVLCLACIRSTLVVGYWERERDGLEDQSWGGTFDGMAVQEELLAEREEKAVAR